MLKAGTSFIEVLLTLLLAPYLWIALAYAPNDPHCNGQDPQGTESDVDLWLLHAHDEHADHHQEEAQDDESIAEGFLVSH